jgi:hypothetical protein
MDILSLSGYLDIWGVIRKVSEYRPMAGVMRKVSGYGGGEGVVRSVWISTRFGALYGKFLDIGGLTIGRRSSRVIVPNGNGQ